MQLERLKRFLNHLLLPDWWFLRAFPEAALRGIEQAIVASERAHHGELRFVVEAGLPVAALLRQQTTRDRALELFSLLRIWDTEDNSGVLIYVQLLDQRVEIVADRGIDAKVGDAFWSAVCRRMETEFAQRRFASGSVSAIDAITVALAEHFPARGDNPDELANAPLLR